MSARMAFIACGSNIDPRPNLAAALARLEAVAERVRTSPTYLTRPWGMAAQAPYLNLVVGVRTEAAPHLLLGRLQAIERALGRTRTVPFGPRTIDLDILLYGNLVIDDTRLTVPHPGLTERDFMLVPLLDIAPCLTHPADGEPLAPRRHRITYRQIVCRVLP
ncbi:MAG: 2-amino-4-hydroxy-6-hydroxymethyldihydropteridine diphosphokinase [Spirochaetaceae bacterium]|nr:2-amino-4-hydroxy-6-hydroxymethyldihydropteridine diphosphokinase [Spirochaetaceae bacterium]